jgi:hypothetical protein
MVNMVVKIVSSLRKKDLHVPFVLGLQVSTDGKRAEVMIPSGIRIRTTATQVNILAEFLSAKQRTCSDIQISVSVYMKKNK